MRHWQNSAEVEKDVSRKARRRNKLNFLSDLSGGDLSSPILREYQSLKVNPIKENLILDLDGSG